jgi:hypothetical protein
MNEVAMNLQYNKESKKALMFHIGIKSDLMKQKLDGDNY